MVFFAKERIGNSNLFYLTFCLHYATDYIVRKLFHFNGRLVAEAPLNACICTKIAVLCSSTLKYIYYIPLALNKYTTIPVN